MNGEEVLVSMSNAPDLPTIVLGMCHSLVKIDGKIAGDPVEAAAIKAIRWDIQEERIRQSTMISTKSSTKASFTPKVVTICKPKKATSNGKADNLMIEGLEQTKSFTIED